jgi:hypothetical protein
MSTNADEAQPTPSPNLSTGSSSEDWVSEWADRFEAAAIKGFPKVVERNRKASEAYYARVERRIVLAKLAEKLGLPAPDPWDSRPTVGHGGEGNR